MSTVWACTYNVGNEVPGDLQLGQIAGTIPNNTDLLVFGLQEAKKMSGVFTRFRSHISGEYLPVTTKKMYGTTKFFDEGINGQGIAAFARRGACTGDRGISLGMDDTVSMSARTKRAGGSVKKGIVRQFSGIAGKGGVGIVVDWGGSKLGFVSVHMGTKVANHSAEYSEIFTTTHNRTSPSTQDVPCLNGFVVMGDINIRLSKLPQSVSNTGSVNSLYAQLAAADKRLALFNLNEPDVNETYLVKNKHFVFPVPKNGTTNAISYPTYKRKVGQSGQFDQTGGALIQKMNDCYELKSLKGKHGGGPEIGWLDRVGYLAGPDGPVIQFQNAEVRTIPQVSMSDHSPVYMTATVVIP